MQPQPTHFDLKVRKKKIAQFAFFRPLKIARAPVFSFARATRARYIREQSRMRPFCSRVELRDGGKQRRVARARSQAATARQDAQKSNILHLHFLFIVFSFLLFKIVCILISTTKRSQNVRQSDTRNFGRIESALKLLRRLNHLFRVARNNCEDFDHNHQ